MSYNIDTWKTKNLAALKIPLAEIKKLPYVTIEMDSAIGEITARGLAEMFEIAGPIKEGWVSVDTIKHCGEGSGHTWDNLLSCLRASRGELIATQVWEGGDSITRLTVKDGDVKEEQIEI